MEKQNRERSGVEPHAVELVAEGERAVLSFTGQHPGARANGHGLPEHRTVQRNGRVGSGQRKGVCIGRKPEKPVIQHAPANVVNRIALLLDKDSLRWIKLDDMRWLLRQGVSAFGCLGEDGNFKGDATVTSYDYARMALLDSAAVAPDLAEDKEERPAGLQILQQRFLQTDNDDEPVKQQMTFAYAIQKNRRFIFCQTPVSYVLEKESVHERCRKYAH